MLSLVVSPMHDGTFVPKRRLGRRDATSLGQVQLQITHLITHFRHYANCSDNFPASNDQRPATNKQHHINSKPRFPYELCVASVGMQGNQKITSSTVLMAKEQDHFAFS